MGLPIVRIAAGVFRAAAKIVGVDVLNEAAKTVEALQMTPEQEQAFKVAVMEHERELRQLDIEEIKTAMGESLAMIGSSDKYISRARPTGLYIAYVCTAAMAVALIAGKHIDATAILTLMGPLYGAQGYYMHLRTKEKLNGGNGD